MQVKRHREKRRKRREARAPSAAGRRLPAERPQSGSELAIARLERVATLAALAAPPPRHIARRYGSASRFALVR